MISYLDVDMLWKKFFCHCLFEAPVQFSTKMVPQHPPMYQFLPARLHLLPQSPQVLLYKNLLLSLNNFCQERSIKDYQFLQVLRQLSHSLLLLFHQILPVNNPLPFLKACLQSLEFLLNVLQVLQLHYLR